MEQRHAGRGVGPLQKMSWDFFSILEVHFLWQINLHAFCFRKIFLCWFTDPSIPNIVKLAINPMLFCSTLSISYRALIVLIKLWGMINMMNWYNDTCLGTPWTCKTPQIHFPFYEIIQWLVINNLFSNVKLYFMITSWHIFWEFFLYNMLKFSPFDKL